MIFSLIYQISIFIFGHINQLVNNVIRIFSTDQISLVSKSMQIINQITTNSYISSVTQNLSTCFLIKMLCTLGGWIDKQAAVEVYKSQFTLQCKV